MKYKIKCLNFFIDERGAIAIIAALVVFFVLIGIGALAVDVGRMTTTKNELQNSADAGALAGTSVLFIKDYDDNLCYNDAPSFEAVKLKAREAAEKNVAFGKKADVEKVEVGHWGFGGIGFTPFKTVDENKLIMPSELLGYMTKQNIGKDNYQLLNEMNGSGDDSEQRFFVNAVRVKTTNDNDSGFFSNIFKIENPTPISAHAVAFIDSAGAWAENHFDYPIGVCEESLDGEFCNTGRMLEDNVEGDTAQWTNFSQPCVTTNPSNMAPILDTCGAGNPDPIAPGEIGTTLGVTTPVFEKMKDCWISENDGGLVNCNPGEKKSFPTPTQPWSMLVPVLKCNAGEPNCRELVSAMHINVLWMLGDGVKPEENSPCVMGPLDNEEDYNNYPEWKYYEDEIVTEGCKKFNDQIGNTIEESMHALGEEWTSSRWQGEQYYEESMARWDCFVNHFGIKTPSGKPAYFAKKTIYFAPDCTRTDQAGFIGGEYFFGVFSEVPVLVE